MAICQQIHTDSTFPHKQEFKTKVKAGSAPFENVHCGEERVTQRDATEDPTTSKTLVCDGGLCELYLFLTVLAKNYLNHWKLIMLLLLLNDSNAKPQNKEEKEIGGHAHLSSSTFSVWQERSTWLPWGHTACSQEQTCKSPTLICN